MKKRYRKIEQRLFSGGGKAVWSHLLVFLVPFLLVSFIWFNTSTQSINQQVALNARNQLLQLKYSLENNFLQLDNITQRIPYDHQLSLKNLDHPYYAREGRANLQKSKLSNEIVDEIYLYFKDEPNVFFSTVGKMSRKTFLHKEIPNGLLDDSQIQEYLNVSVPKLLTTRKNLQDRNNAKFFYIVPLQNSEMVTYGAAVYTIKESSLMNLLDLTNNDGASTNYLVNNQNQILASTQENELTAYLSEDKQIADLTTKGSFHFQGNNYLIERLQNKNLALSYVSVTNPAKALSTINQMQWNFMSIFLAVLLSGIAAVIILGLRSYRPIRKIEGLVQDYTRAQGTTVTATDVHQTIANFLLEHRELHDEIRLQTPHAREQVLRKLLGGRFKSEEELKLLLQSVHVQLPAGQYFVLAINGKSTNIGMENESVFLMDYVEMIQEAGYSAYATEILSTEVIAVTVGFTAGDQAGILQSITHLLAEKLEILPKIGIGGVINDLTSLNASYIEALAALDYCDDREKIVYYSEILSEEYSSTISYPDGKRLKLIQSLNQGDLAIATETIKLLMAHGIAEQKSPAAQKMYGFYILNTLAKAGSGLTGEGVLQKAEESASFNTLSELEQNLLALAEMICQAVQNKPQNQESQLRERLFTYIQAHFTSSQLSLEMVAEEFDLSVSYLSRFIKKESNMTFSKYIQGLRLEKIKRSLVETDLPIKEIIRECGYYDVSNYTRKFRTIVGVTPGQYRSINRNNSL